LLNDHPKARFDRDAKLWVSGYSLPPGTPTGRGVLDLKIVWRVEIITGDLVEIKGGDLG
jgi:hypothetical protein